VCQPLLPQSDCWASDSQIVCYASRGGRGCEPVRNEQHFIHKWSISPNYVRQAKRFWRRTAFGKKNRHSISPTKLKPNLCAEICQKLFTICPICVPKKLLILWACMLMKSTQGYVFYVKNILFTLSLTILPLSHTHRHHPHSVTQTYGTFSLIKIGNTWGFVAFKHELLLLKEYLVSQSC